MYSWPRDLEPFIALCLDYRDNLPETAEGCLHVQAQSQIVQAIFCTPTPPILTPSHSSATMASTPASLPCPHVRTRHLAFYLSYSITSCILQRNYHRVALRAAFEWCFESSLQL